jgi:hypothetical protein
MSLRNRVLRYVASLGLTALAGCGGSTNLASPPPSGAFSNSNLSGTYIFSFSGYDVGYGNGSFFAVVGSLTANGSGTFTGGTVDIDDPSLGESFQSSNVLTHVPVTGTYNITADGRGSGTIAFSVNGSEVQFGLDFVLASGSHGLITRFDDAGSGSGTIDPQVASVSQGTLQGSYVFGLYGVDASTVSPLSAAGSVTLDASGNVTTGIEDFNDNGNSFNLQALNLQGALVTGIPGTAQLTSNAGSFGALKFDVWPIDSTHLKLIEIDSVSYLEGDAFVSTGHTAFPSGALVYTLGGKDSTQGPFAAGGLLTSDGSGNITTGLEDVNDQGDVASAPNVTGTFTSNGPRTVLTLNGIYNGAFPNYTLSAGNYTFAAYPFSGGVMLLEIDNGAGSSLGVSSGSIYIQTATSLASSQGYGLNLSGVNSNGEADMVAEFAASGDTMNGLYDVNNSGFLVRRQSRHRNILGGLQRARHSLIS